MGTERKNHSYIARVPLGSGEFRYFYNAQELAAYKKNKASIRVVRDNKDKKENTEQKPKPRYEAVPEKHIPTSATGKFVSDYKPGEKPKRFSDEQWARLQKLWYPNGIMSTPAIARVRRKNKKSKSIGNTAAAKIATWAIKKTTDSKKKHTSGQF